MDPKIAQEILDDLIPSLEALEAKSTAALEFLKHEGIASEEKLAPFLEHAANSSNVRWRGVRVRIERLLSSAEKDSEDKRSKEKEEKKPETAQTKPAEKSQPRSEAEDNSKSAGPENPNENTHKNKNAETLRKDAESKSKAASNDSTHYDKNGKHPRADGEKSREGESGTEKKVA